MADGMNQPKQEGENSTRRGTHPDRGSWKTSFATAARNWHFIVILALLLLIALMYYWNTAAEKKAETEIGKQKSSLTERAVRIVSGKNKALVRLTAIPLSWAVRPEMIRGNYENIDQYFRFLIREDRFKAIVLAGSDGAIIVATDKRMEGSKLAKIYPQSVPEQPETKVIPLDNGELMAVTPVTGLTGRLGTLILVYSPGVVSLEAPGS
jgi:hypothetical protein